MENIPIIQWVMFGALLAFLVFDKARYYIGRNGKKKDVNEALGKILEDNRNSLNQIINTSNGKYIDHDRKINKNTTDICHLGKKINKSIKENREDHKTMFTKLDDLKK